MKVISDCSKEILTKNSQEALSRLTESLESMGNVVIAYSGGMDSGFLGLAAKKAIPKTFRMFLAASEVMPHSELEKAQKLAERFSLPLKIINLSVFSTTGFSENSKARCYYCKKGIFSQLLKEAPEGWFLCDGSNADDRKDFRPGKKALAELGVRSPLEEAGFNKNMIREVLSAWKAEELIRPPQACLATRIPVGMQITPTILEQIAKGENCLRKVGLQMFRLRYHKEVARIEVPQSEIFSAMKLIAPVVPELKNLGFKHVSIDIEGYRQGSMNE